MKKTIPGARDPRTLAYYDRNAETFWERTRDHDVRQNVAALLDAIEGSPPSLIRVPPGCPFHPRCPHRFAPCDQERPEFRDRGGGHEEACHLSVEDKRRLWASRRAARMEVAV